jgi:hypothetical protein
MAPSSTSTPGSLAALIPRRASRLSFVGLALAICACNDSTGPRPSRGEPGLHILAGGGLTDTVVAILPQAILAEVRDTRGYPMPGVVVHFDALPVDSAHPFIFTAYLRRIQDQFFRDAAVDTTDESGRARIQVKFGPSAGPVSVLVHLDAEAGIDTVRYTAHPGHAGRVVASVHDTAVFAGRTLVIGTRVTDVYGNVRSGDSVSFTVDSGSVGVGANGAITTTEPTRARVVAHSGAAVDIVNVSVVPPGAMAVVYFPLNATAAQLATVNLDGSNLTLLTSLTSTVAAPQWRPDGSLIVFQDTDPNNGHGHLFTVDLAGHRQRLTSQLPDSVVAEDRPRYAATNDWVYFDGYVNAVTSSNLWRVRPDGTGAEAVPPSLPETAGWQVAPSPDDTRILYSAGAVYSLDIASGTSTFVGPGSSASWSPDGAHIAYLANGTLSIMNADGSGARALSTVHHYDFAFVPNWSSDGEWIVLRGPDSAELIRVATGDVIPLPFARGMYQPSLEP